jgi:queuine/archaeosine tRNA-ribosyltransferase
LQRYKLKNLPFFKEAREALENKCDCPHCRNKYYQAENAGKYYKNLSKNCKKFKKSHDP